jgi:hypothetical protein
MFQLIGIAVCFYLGSKICDRFASGPTSKRLTTRVQRERKELARSLSACCIVISIIAAFSAFIVAVQ